MPQGYSRDLRERLLQAHSSGLSAAEIQRTMGVSPNSLGRWLRKQASGASLEPGHSTGARRKISREEESALRAQVIACPDATLAEHCTRWVVAGHTRVSTATMSRTLTRLGLPLKKRR